MRGISLLKMCWGGSPHQGLSLGTAGQENFNIFVTKPPRGRPFGGSGVDRILGKEASATIFVIYSVHALPIQNSDEPFL